MAVRPILRLGDPRLREVAAPVTQFDTPELHELVRDLLETMQAADGAGLAAVQIGVPQRVVIFGVDYNPRYPKADPVPFTVLVNPEITRGGLGRLLERARDARARTAPCADPLSRP